MRNESLAVYERPEAEEVKMVFETRFLDGSIEGPSCPTYKSCPNEFDFCMEY